MMISRLETKDGRVAVRSLEPGRLPTLGIVILLVFLPLFSLAGESNQMARELRASVYRAEVLGEAAAALNDLRMMLGRAEESDHRAEIVRTIAIVKMEAPRPFPAAPPALVASRAMAVLAYRGNAHLYVSGRWLELGDWLEEGYLSQIRPEGFFLTTPGTPPREWAMNQFNGFSPIWKENEDYCVVNEVRVGDLLELISKREGLSSFFPSAIQNKVSGVFPLSSWQGFLDRICEEAGIQWTRRRDNLVFRAGLSSENDLFPKINLDRKNQNLVTFLQNLAEAMSLELVLDEGLGDINVDIHLQDQAWDEVLDCLSIMNGFNWSLIREGLEPPKLFIHKD